MGAGYTASWRLLTLYLSCLPSLLVAIAGFAKPVPPALPEEGLASEHNGSSVFQQYIDHSNPGLGTFSQRFWWNTTFWGGPGYPIVLFTPGEAAADAYTGYLTDRALTGLQAKAIKGAVVLIEHRYWGKSSPYPIQDTKALQYLTLQNSVADLVHFARTVNFTFDSHGASNAPRAPWVLTGGSYSGALSAWTEKLSPGTFWAYHATSAPVQAIYNYWEYFYPIQQGMPKNCSLDFERIVEAVDKTLLYGTSEQVAELQDKFGLKELKHRDDFASAFTLPLGNWQSTSFSTGYGDFYQMCDAIEGFNMSSNASSKNPSSASPFGVGATQALSNYAKYFKTSVLPGYCQGFNYTDWNDTLSVGCFDTYNKSSPMFTDWSPDNQIDRPWVWFTCNEPLFYWQTGAPPGVPTIASRFANAEYFQRQCSLFFPNEGWSTYGSGRGETAKTVNGKTEGWFLTDTTRLLWANGEFDPWRSASVSSVFRPWGPLQSRPEAPIFLLKNATHCQDLLVRDSAANAALAQAQAAMVAQMKTWVDEFYEGKWWPRSTASGRRSVRRGLSWGRFGV